MTTQVTSAREAAEIALKALLNDKIGRGGTEAYTAAMAAALGMVESGVDNLVYIADYAVAFYDGYEAALAKR